MGNDLAEFLEFEEDLMALDALDGIRQPKVFKTRFNPFDLQDELFRSKYRFSKENIKKIIAMVRPNLEGDRRGGKISPELQVLAAIRSWARNEIQDDGADIHGFSQQQMSKVRKRVATAIAQLAPTIIKMPVTLGEQEMTVRQFENICGFPQVIGAIDCTHIKIRKVSGELGQFYINRKNYYSLNVQIVGDATLRICDIVAHWRGSTHDARIFRESRIKERFDNNEFRGRLLGDGGYPCSRYLFTPVLNPANVREERYNKAQITTRNTVERLFGVWKQRFWCLLRGMTGSLETIKITIVALAVLHNLAIEYNEEIFDDDNHEIPNLQDNQPEINLEFPLERNLAGPVERRLFINNHF